LSEYFPVPQQHWTPHEGDHPLTYTVPGPVVSKFTKSTAKYLMAECCCFYLTFCASRLVVCKPE
jgi:hypothetical protein